MTRERIAEIRKEQDRLRVLASEVEPPALLFLTDDDSVSIRGNESGLIHLAIELLEVSAGGQVWPATAGWIDATWLPLESIVLDPEPRIETPKPTFIGNVFAYIFLGAILIFFLVGAITSFTWLARLLHF